MRPSYGSIVESQRVKEALLEDDVAEYTRLMSKIKWEELNERAAHDAKLPYYENKDFYVVLALRKEHIGNNPQFIIWTRLSCPTPTYNQNVFKYHHLSATLEYLWTIPTALTYWHLYKNSEKYLKDPQRRDVTRFVCLMESGELEKWVIKENGEKPDGAIIIKEKEN